MSSIYSKVSDYNKIIIKNFTDENLKDIYLTYKGLVGDGIKIKEIQKKSEIVKYINTINIKRKSELILYYYKDNKIEEIIVYDNLNYKDKRDIVVKITRKKGRLYAEGKIQEEVKREETSKILKALHNTPWNILWTIILILFIIAFIKRTFY